MITEFGRLIREVVAGWLLMMAMKTMTDSMLQRLGPRILEGLQEHEQYLRARHV